jgi:hypothetical protein
MIANGGTVQVAQHVFRDAAMGGSVGSDGPGILAVLRVLGPEFLRG